MIAKAVKGKGFRGALAYDLAPEKGALLDTNMAGETPRELAAEFGAIRALRPGLTKAVLHVSLSAAPGDQLSDEQWREIGQRYLAGMDLDHNQYVLTRHTDTAHEHIHIVANRIGFDGSVTSDSHDYQRMHTLMREIEHDYGLEAVTEPGRRAPRPDQRRARADPADRRGVHPPPAPGPVRRRGPGLPQLHRLPGTARSRGRRDHPDRAARRGNTVRPPILP